MARRGRITLAADHGRLDVHFPEFRFVVALERALGLANTMKNALTTLLLAASLSHAAACGQGETTKAKATAVATEEAAQLLLDRNWMDLWPESETEKLRVFRFVPNMGGGVFQDRTLFQGSFELFTFRVSEDTIHFDLHHTKEKVPAKFRIERVEGPEPFDLRLTLDRSPRGPSVYFGRSSETVTDLGLRPLPKMSEVRER